MFAGRTSFLTRHWKISLTFKKKHFPAILLKFYPNLYTKPELEISTYYIALENEINFVKLQIVCLLYGLLCCTIRLEMDTGASLVLLYYRLSSPLLNRCLLPPVDMVWYQSSLHIAEFLKDIVQWALVPYHIIAEFLKDIIQWALVPYHIHEWQEAANEQR